MTPAFAVVALLAVLLVFLPVVALIVRLIGARLLARASGPPPLDSAHVEPLGALEVAGVASGTDLAALSQRERRFVAGTVTPHLVSGELPAVRNGASHTPPDREVAVDAFVLVCPACGASLGAVADVAHYIGSCPSCLRRVAARRRGARVSLTAMDTVRPSRRRPR